MRVLVTGATGFVGSALVEELLKNGILVTALVRDFSVISLDGLKPIVGDLNDIENIASSLFEGVECVVHAAARAHIVQNNSKNALTDYMKTNRDATLKLAELASKHGVKRFVFLSSIKVNGEKTPKDGFFLPDSRLYPRDPYGLSKYEAELGVKNIGTQTGMEYVIIRPPLVYGPKVKGNFASMLFWLRREVPMPFGSVENKRSFVALDNLVDFIILCANKKQSPNAANQVFLISDDRDLSIPELMRLIAKAYQFKLRLFPVPLYLLKWVAIIFGKAEMIERLVGNLQVDTSKVRKLTGWQPIVSIEEQLNKMAQFSENSDR